jgi:tetratricopeptide (TPR) repeat protein
MPELSAAQARAFGLYNKGVEAFAHRDYEKSVEYLTEALGQEPTAAGGYLARGRANIELERTDEAIADLTRAIELNPSSLVALRERARAHRLRGAIDLAERDERIAAAIEKAKNPDRD